MHKEATRTKRVTLGTIAQECGLSKAAVSYALSGRRGVAETTRQLVEETAARLGWEPPRRQVSRGRGRPGAVGLLVPQPVEVLTEESFTVQFISGLETTLGEYGSSLLLQFEPDERLQFEIYRSWMAMNVTKVVLLDVIDGESRLAYLPRLGFEVVSTCPPTDPATQCVYTDDGQDMTQLLRALRETGHRSFMHISGPLNHSQVSARVQAWKRFFEEHADCDGLTIPTNWVSQRSYASIETGLRQRFADAMVFDSDRLALLGLRAAQTLGRRVPEDVSVVSFEDSLLCRAVGLGAVQRDPRELGHRAGVAILGIDRAHRQILPPAQFRPRRTART